MPRCGCMGKPRIGPSSGSLKAKWSNKRKGSKRLLGCGEMDRRKRTPAPSIANCGSIIFLIFRACAWLIPLISYVDFISPNYIKGFEPKQLTIYQRYFRISNSFRIFRVIASFASEGNSADDRLETFVAK